jgi:hypothetical protein
MLIGGDDQIELREVSCRDKSNKYDRGEYTIYKNGLFNRNNGCKTWKRTGRLLKPAEVYNKTYSARLHLPIADPGRALLHAGGVDITGETGGKYLWCQETGLPPGLIVPYGFVAQTSYSDPTILVRLSVYEAKGHSEKYVYFSSNSFRYGEIHMLLKSENSCWDKITPRPRLTDIPASAWLFSSDLKNWDGDNRKIGLKGGSRKVSEWTFDIELLRVLLVTGIRAYFDEKGQPVFTASSRQRFVLPCEYEA